MKWLGSLLPAVFLQRLGLSQDRVRNQGDQGFHREQLVKDFPLSLGFDIQFPPTVVLRSERSWTRSRQKTGQA